MREYHEFSEGDIVRATARYKEVVVSKEEWVENGGYSLGEYGEEDFNEGHLTLLKIVGSSKVRYLAVNTDTVRRRFSSV